MYRFKKRSKYWKEVQEVEKEIQDILFEQLKQLSELSKEVIEPEQVVQISLAMVEIAKLFNLYRDSQEFDELL